MPAQVGGKYFFTADNKSDSVEKEAVALGRFAWHLLGPGWDKRQMGKETRPREVV